MKTLQTCLTCGLEFKHSFKLVHCYCSSECSPNGRFVEVIKLTCLQCRKNYYRSLSDHKSIIKCGKYESTFCSNACANKQSKVKNPIPEIDRFWAKVDKTPGLGPNGDCWEWRGGKRGEYGRFSCSVDGKSIGYAPHRYSYSLHHSIDLKSLKLQILHDCDNPPCCNPAHLREGTQKDNMVDKKNKRRGVYGENHSQSILTEGKVKFIRTLFSHGGWTYAHIARMMKITPETIRRVILRHVWDHVE